MDAIDGLLNLVIILIPLGIFIGRAFLRAKSRGAAREAAQTEPQARQQVEEEYDDDGNDHLPHWLRAPKTQNQRAAQAREDEADLPHWERTAKQKEKAAVKKEPESSLSVSYSLLRGDFHSAASIDTPLSQGTTFRERADAQMQRAAAPIAPARQPVKKASPKRGGFAGLARLSHLQQAVIMAEVLGPPKSSRQH